jgi:uncharacterized protein YggE
MKKIVLLGLLLIASTRAGFAQVSGGAGGYGGSSSAYAGTASVSGNNIDPTQNEWSKRQATAAELKDDGTSTFVEASILLNVKADEYVAVFGVMEEGKTPEEANAKMDATISSFKESLKSFGIKEDDLFVDFVTQNRIYAYRIEETIAKEELVGFELKKNISIHFKDKLLVDKMVVAAARSQIFDLIKADYLVNDRPAIQARLQAQTVGIIRQKAGRYQTLLGVKLFGPTQVLVDKPSVYYPVEQYDSYTAAESENINIPYDRSRYTVQNARKSRTTYFNPLSGDGFDTVINPIIIEPVVQFTTYIKVKYEAQKNRKK